MNVMMPNSFSEKIAQREELSAAYERIDEVESALRMVRDYLHQPRYAGSTLAEDCTDEFLGTIDDVLDHVVIAPAEAFAAVFLNGC